MPKKGPNWSLASLPLWYLPHNSNGPYFYNQDWTQAWRMVSSTKKEYYFEWEPCEIWQESDGKLVSLCCFWNIALDPSVNSLGPYFSSRSIGSLHLIIFDIGPCCNSTLSTLVGLFLLCNHSSTFSEGIMELICTCHHILHPHVQRRSLKIYQV